MTTQPEPRSIRFLTMVKYGLAFGVGLAALVLVLVPGAARAQETTRQPGLVVLDDGRACPMAAHNGMFLHDPLGLYPLYQCHDNDWLLGDAPPVGGQMIEWTYDPQNPEAEWLWQYRQVTVADLRCTWYAGDTSTGPNWHDQHVVCP
jgi:hypothetical protein